MESIHQFSKRVIKSYEEHIRATSERENEMSLHVRFYLVGVFKTIKDINEKGEPGRTDKISELGRKYGIPIKDIL